MSAKNNFSKKHIDIYLLTLIPQNFMHIYLNKKSYLNIFYNFDSHNLRNFISFFFLKHMRH